MTPRELAIKLDLRVKDLIEHGEFDQIGLLGRALAHGYSTGRRARKMGATMMQTGGAPPEYDDLGWVQDAWERSWRNGFKESDAQARASDI